MPKKKKEHYVPQGYLEKWCIPNTNQVNVFDKEQDNIRINNIIDVASENYFYDFNFEGVFSEQEIKFYNLEGIDLSRIDDKQHIENYFATHIEGIFKSALENIIFRVRKMNVWEIKNCFFIKPEQVFSFSKLIALQYIRVKQVRNTIQEATDLLKQALTDKNVADEVIDKYTNVSKNQLKFIHGKMILDNDTILHYANTFANHAWILLKNKTNQPFFTSDNPIGTTEHIHNPYMSMSGICSKGVEIFFPLSPDLMLLMFEKTHHNDINSKNYRIIEIDERDIIDDYNSRCVMNSSRCVFSQTDDFSVVKKMKEKKPDVLQLPKTVLTWGGKTYTVK